MYIRRTTIKSRKNGKPYCTYRLVESVRTSKGVRQHTLLNLGSNFSCPRESWPDLAKRIGEIISGQNQLFPPASDLEDMAQRYAALIIQSQNRADGIDGDGTTSSNYRNVDINTLEFMRPRSIGAENTESQQLFKQGKPTIIMDAGIATEDNINWLKKKQYHYLVVSRKRHREFSEKDAMVVKTDKDCTVKAYKKLNDKTGEVELYCHSTRREDKERAIYNRFSTRFEEALDKLDSGLHKKRCVKKYDKVLLSLGRLKQKYSRAAKNYRITVKKDKKTGNATRIIREKKQLPNSTDSYAGVYCLRTNQNSWDESTLWRTYTMLTDLEAVFRSLKSELGLRPVFHQKTERVSGHLFITLLAYHLIHTIRCQLKMNNIHSSWSNLRKQLKGQDRITVSMNCQNGETVHIRKSTRPEPRQQVIYDALGLTHYPGRAIKKVVPA